MKYVRLAAAIVNQTPLDWPGNAARLRETLQEARRQEVSVLCLPELCLTGYGCEDAFHSTEVQERSLRLLLTLLPETVGMAVCFGLPLRHQNSLYNAVCLAANGQILGFVAKRFLAGDGIHYEPRWFKAWPEGIAQSYSWGGHQYPLGDLLFDLGGVRLGFEICEDAWVAARPGAALARRGVDLILNPSASHFAFGKIDVRERFVIEGSRAFHAGYVYANLLGNESGRAIFDGGALLASGGRLLARGPRFSFRDWLLTTGSLDIDANRIAQSRTASHRPSYDPGGPHTVTAPFDWPVLSPPPFQPPDAPAWENSPHWKEEEFTRAVALGLCDYLRKSRSRGFVVSLSGGADSAAVVCLVRYMVELGGQELGLERLRERLGIRPPGLLPDSPTALTGQLLATAYQATANSSIATRDSARQVAAAVGSRHCEFDVEPLVRQYLAIVSQAEGRTFHWETDDIALQNIQARVRAPGVWMLANLHDSLLLATSNRSEAAVGYATMDGDTCGGLSPIAGIDKAFLRQWLRWVENDGPEGLPAIPALACVNRLQPTAELRPPNQGQTDEDDLMPYPILDAIEKAAIRDKLGPAEAFALLEARFPDHPRASRLLWVERFFRLWARNQWKRERYAPSFHLDDENLDPKTWCRFPILSGAWTAELAELREAVQPALQASPRTK